MAVKTEKIQYNQLPRPTFRWMKVNHLELDPLKAQALPAYTPEERHDGEAAVAFYEGNQIVGLNDFQGSNAEELDRKSVV